MVFHTAIIAAYANVGQPKKVVIYSRFLPMACKGDHGSFFFFGYVLCLLNLQHLFLGFFFFICSVLSQPATIYF